MGNSKSKGTSTAEFKVFAKEQEDLNKIVSSIVNKENVFANKSYNVGDPEQCGKYTMVLESQLKKHLKIDLKNLKDSIYVLPSEDSVKLQDAYLKKEEICKLISAHYKTILQVLTTIKYVYDIEGFGVASLAGITLGNVRFDKNMFIMQYCAVAQKQTIDMKESDPDFSTSLRGFKYYCDYLLTPSEKNTLFKNMRLLLSNTNKTKMARYLFCGDSLMTGKEYEDIFKPLELNKKQAKCQPLVGKRFTDYVNTAEENSIFNIAAFNPVLSDAMCPGNDKKTIILDCSENKAEHKKLRTLHNKMKDDYIKSLNSVLGIAKKLVKDQEGADAQFVLNNIDSKTLEAIIRELKRNVARFYIESIVNFHALFKYAKSLPSNIVDAADLYNHGNKGSSK